jgi:hypothetical protein
MFGENKKGYLIFNHTFWTFLKVSASMGKKNVIFQKTRSNLSRRIINNSLTPVFSRCQRETFERF